MPDIKKLTPTAKPIADVAHPGQTPPSETSKPVIVNNRAVLKDPMVVSSPDGSEDSTGLAAKPKPKSPPSVKLKPFESADSTAELEAESEAAAAEPVETSTSEKTSPEPATPEKPQDPSSSAASSTTEPPSDKSETSDANDGDVQAAGPETDQQLKPDDLEAEAAKQAEHDDAIQKLIDTKQYELPINSVEKRRTKRFLILGVVLSVLLIVAWADIALDAGLVQLGGLKSVTHFFSS